MPWKLTEPAIPCSFLGKLQSFILRVEFPGFKSLNDYSVCEAKIARQEEVTMVGGRQNTSEMTSCTTLSKRGRHIECEQTVLMGVFMCKC